MTPAEEEGGLMPKPEYRCVQDACGWEGDEPGWEGDEPDWEEADEETSPGIPICPRCEGEVEQRIHPDDSRTGLAAYEMPQDPLEERRQALLDYLDSTITWRADHRVAVGSEESLAAGRVGGISRRYGARPHLALRSPRTGLWDDLQAARGVDQGPAGVRRGGTHPPHDPHRGGRLHGPDVLTWRRLDVKTS